MVAPRKRQEDGMLDEITARMKMAEERATHLTVSL